MNKIYKVVWNATRGCYVVASELVKTHRGKKSVRRGGSILSRAGTALLLAIAGWGAACNFIYADVNVADPAHTGKVDKTPLAGGGTQYDIYNQQVNNGSALNKFTDFGIGQKDVANLQLGSSVDRQINLVKNRINIDGVVNAIKDNKIGGDVYFFSNAGIMVGKTGVFNVGQLTLGTNAAYGEALYNGGMEKHLAQSATAQAKAVAGGSDITLQGKVYVQGDVIVGAGDVSLNGAAVRTHVDNAGTYAAQKTADEYRNQLVNINTPSATVATALGKGDVALAAVGVPSEAESFETKGAIVIDKAYIDAAGGDTSVIACAERNGGNLMGSQASASVDISNATIKGQHVGIAAKTEVSGKVGSADAYKTAAEEDGILGLLHATFDEQVGNLASVVKTGADSLVTVKDSQLTAAEDLTISSMVKSEIGSETGGALGVGINVGIADVSSKVEIQGTSALTAGQRGRSSHRDRSWLGGSEDRCIRQCRERGDAEGERKCRRIGEGREKSLSRGREQQRRRHAGPRGRRHPVRDEGNGRCAGQSLCKWQGQCQRIRYRTKMGSMIPIRSTSRARAKAMMAPARIPFTTSWT